jgi:class 3 adenylate cyclase/DNA-binding SARP family transcriptional activator/predicted ATPase
VEFGILGPLAVWSEGRELVLGAAKQRALLASLLLRAGEPVPVARLVDDLWGERPPATAVKAAQVYVSQLRKTLGEGVIETHPLGYLLRLEPDDVDVHRFERRLERGRRLLAEGDAAEAATELSAALATWRGPALADFRYEAFARNEAARLDELRVVALEARLEAELALGRHAEAVPELETLVQEHPLRESLRGLLMLALYRTGRQADALAVYQQTREVLREELGLSPGRALQELERAILVQDPALQPRRPAPAAPTAPRAAVVAPVCASCGTANAHGAAFCRACGAALGSDASPETRKTVTVLFCDVVAFTELAGRLDPEALRRVISELFELAAATIEHHGGTVEKFLGDEVMAVFGVPVVREDDALRAVRAALDLRERVAALEPAGTRVELRIGINSGEVVAGDAAAGHGFVTGDAIVVGKRLQQAAAPGEVLLGEETHALVAHAVHATPLERLEAKGRSGGLAAFRLDSVDESAPALPRREDAPLVGRARELDRLRELYAAAASGRGGRHVTVVGEPGIGKSRLAREFLGGVADEATVLVGRCPPYGEGITFWPLRELLRQAGRGENLLDGPSHEVFAAARGVLEELARERPLVAAFDDVQWGEPTFLDFVEYLAGRLGASPVLLLCLARPELAELRPAWLHEPAAAIVLDPLSELESERLLETIGVPPAARRRLAEAAEGNPLFVEQLAAIAETYGATGAMPATIRGVLHERLDRLDREERVLLERAAVTGRSFSLDAVLDLSRPEEREGAQARLLALVRKRLVQPDPSAADEGFRFHHALIRDAAYDGIPKSARAELHERVAERLDARGAEEAVVGHHLEQAHRLRRELGREDAALGVRAGRLLHAAGQKAFALSDLPATVSLLERARPLLTSGEAARLLPELGEALFEAGRFAEAEQVLEQALAAAGNDPVLESRALVEQQFLRLQSEPLGDLGTARDVAAAALRRFDDAGDEIGRCRALCLIAWIEWTEGRVTAADEAWQRAAACAVAAGEERELFEIVGWRASAAVEGPTPVDDAIRTCAELREQVGSSPVAVAVILHPLAALHAMRGELEQARALVREANATLAGLDRMQSAVSHHEALVELLAGDPAAAEARLRTGYERLEQMGEKAVLATTAALLAETLYAQQRYAEAAEFSATSEQTAAAEDLTTQAIWRGVRAELLARDGRFDEAEALAREAVRLVEGTEQLTRRGDALLDLAEVLRLAGSGDEAEAAAREALECYSRKGNVVAAERARLRVAALDPT